MTTTPMSCETAQQITTADIARFTGDFDDMNLTEAEVAYAWKVQQHHHHGFCPCEGHDPMPVPEAVRVATHPVFAALSVNARNQIAR